VLMKIMMTTSWTNGASYGHCIPARLRVSVEIRGDYLLDTL
jgi:hypothetical protein